MKSVQRAAIFSGLCFGLAVVTFANELPPIRLDQGDSKGAAPAVGAEPKTSRELADRVDKRYQGDDSKMKLTLISYNERGEKKVEQMIRYRREKNREKGQLARTLLCYAAPADVRGTCTLTLQQEGDEDQQRIYLPSLKKNRRIAAADKGKSWSGTEFSYEDLREQKLDDFDYSPLSTERYDGFDCYRYSVTPKTPEKSSYSKIETWVRKDILQHVKARYYDKKGNALKELYFVNLKSIQGVWTPQHLLMQNLQDKRKTDFVVNRIVYNTQIDDRMFTPSAMEQVPEDFKSAEDPWAAESHGGKAEGRSSGG